jgi:tRNA-splicing ligase RtcB
MNQCCDKRFIELCEDVQKEKIYGDSLLNQLGTLGGGNHFIELQKDEDGNVHIMIHSGSRNFGAKVANRYCKIAKEHSQHGIPKDLEILESGTSEFYEYQLLMAFATEFAFQNRMVMMEDVKKSLLDFFPETQFHNVINIPHNYARVEGQKDGKNLYVHRKGATFVSSGVVGIIPGSMGSASYIVKGLDNPLSYYSCSHGAGRVMSRRKAKETLSMDTFVEDMKNVPNAEFEKHQLDESPRVYKEIDQVMEQQSDLVTIIKKLLPIRTIKG